VSWAGLTSLSIDGRQVALIGRIDGTSAQLGLTQSGVPDSSPFIEANEYQWTVQLGGATRPGSVILVDQPEPAQLEVPKAPPMTITGISFGPHLVQGSFRFGGMRALSADHPFSGGGWPLVLDGTVSWSCGSSSPLAARGVLG
jgi:hypothetical protein